MSEVPLHPEAASPRSRPWYIGLSLIVALCISQEGTVDPERLDMLRQMVKTALPLLTPSLAVSHSSSLSPPPRSN